VEANRTIHRRRRRTDRDPHYYSFPDAHTLADGISHQYRHSDMDSYIDKNADPHANSASYKYPLILTLSKERRSQVQLILMIIRFMFDV